MVGDWVYRVDFKEPIPVRILGLEVVNYETYPKQYVADVFCPKHNNNVGLYMDEICPIPLTAEILEKNFPTIEDGVTWNETADSDLFNIRVEYDKYVEGIFKYTHELQHALRLAGIDKEIKL